MPTTSTSSPTAGERSSGYFASAVKMTAWYAIACAFATFVVTVAAMVAIEATSGWGPASQLIRYATVVTLVVVAVWMTRYLAARLPSPAEPKAATTPVVIGSVGSGAPSSSSRPSPATPRTLRR